MGDLNKLIAAARSRRPSEQEEQDQRVNFAYGNAADGDTSTVSSIRAASTIIDEQAAAEKTKR